MGLSSVLPQLIPWLIQHMLAATPITGKRWVLWRLRYHTGVCTEAEHQLVVFQKWRWTAINVTLGLIFVAPLRKEWPMTFIAVCCPHCQSDQIVKRGKTARGTQRYLCQNTLCPKGSFLLDYWVVFQKWRWPYLHCPSKGIAIDK